MSLGLNKDTVLLVTLSLLLHTLSKLCSWFSCGLTLNELLSVDEGLAKAAIKQQINADAYLEPSRKSTTELFFENNGFQPAFRFLAKKLNLRCSTGF